MYSMSFLRGRIIISGHQRSAMKMAKHIFIMQPIKKVETFVSVLQVQISRKVHIRIMQMNEERTALTGEKIELFRNTAQWEGNLVEGVSMIRHGEYIYAFYAG